MWTEIVNSSREWIPVIVAAVAILIIVKIYDRLMN